MKTGFKRRDFISTCFKAGAACCTVAYCPGLAAQDKKPDPKKLEYCGYTCPADCTLKKGTLENNIELKKKAFADFKYKEKFGIDFDPEKVFCYGCKSAGDKPLSMPVKVCSVRTCVIEKGIDACIQCDILARCDKALWTNYPKFREKMVELQKNYRG